ncbi:MAG: hypothetical protein LBI49_25065 [Nocardiopsaceae bacterium]|jgi:hypothetical protein|nr:hypothetical protein [Nocardiopsaceae bacterium]
MNRFAVLAGAAVLTAGLAACGSSGGSAVKSSASGSAACTHAAIQHDL